MNVVQEKNKGEKSLIGIFFVIRIKQQKSISTNWPSLITDSTTKTILPHYELMIT